MILCGGHTTGELPQVNLIDIENLGIGGIYLLSDTGMQTGGSATIERVREIIGTGSIDLSDSATIERVREIIGSSGIELTGSSSLGDYTFITETAE